jgi:hypothetical protein
MELDIWPLTPERLPDLAALFGQGGNPKGCWCAFYHVRQLDSATATAETNRASAERPIVRRGV